jgi:Tol biopolymer transport system component
MAAQCAGRFSIQPPAGTEFAPRQLPAVSPDGSRLAAVATDGNGKSRLWIRSLARPADEPVSGPDGASFPFWSPDGEHVGFFAAGRLERVDRAGTGRRQIADAADGYGGSWGPDGAILFAAGAGPSIFSVPSSGGVPRQLTNVPDRSTGRHFWPAFLSDGTHFLYLSIDEHEEGRILLGSLRSADRDPVLAATSPVAYLASGALLSGRGSALLASPFDPNVFQTYGKASVIAHPIARGPSGLTAFSASADGSVVVYADAGSQTVWVDASGREVAAMPEAGAHPRLSPSGKQILVSLHEAGSYAVYDPERDRWLGGESEESSPARWGPDGTEVILTSILAGRTRISARRTDRAAATRTLFDEPGVFRSAATSSARGGLLAVFETQGRAQRLLRVVSLAGKGSVSERTVWQMSVQDPTGAAAISPDGRWIAYAGGEAGSGELYVVALDGAASPARLSPRGIHPVWSGDGGQLFYRTARGIVAVSGEGAVATWAARERLVIPEAILRDRSYDGDAFDVSRDGTRVLLLKSGGADARVALKGLRSCGAGIATLFLR